MRLNKAHVHIFINGFAIRLISVGIWLVLFIGCQEIVVNVGNVGTREKPLEKTGVLENSEIWSGVVRVTGNVTVPEGSSLTIRPGTIVGFDPITGNHHLVIFGSFYAEGEQERMIKFGSLGTEDDPPEAGDWIGIHIKSTSHNSRIAYCHIQDAATAVICDSDTAQLEHCLITGSKSAILCHASPLITQNDINKNGTAIKCVGSISPAIVQNTIQANEFGIICDDRARPKIERNELTNNYQHAIVCYSSAEPEILDNNITRNGGWAVYSGGRLRGNFILGNNESDAIERGTGRDSEQFYGVDEVLEPRSNRVSDAGVQREYNP